MVKIQATSFTTKNKEQFEKWLPNYNMSLLFEDEHAEGITVINPYAPIYFYRLPFEMQIMVMVKYYEDIHNLLIDTEYWSSKEKWAGFVLDNNGKRGWNSIINYCENELWFSCEQDVYRKMFHDLNDLV